MRFMRTRKPVLAVSPCKTIRTIRVNCASPILIDTNRVALPHLSGNRRDEPFFSTNDVGRPFTITLSLLIPLTPMYRVPQFRSTHTDERLYEGMLYFTCCDTHGHFGHTNGVPGSRWFTCLEHDRRCISYWVDETLRLLEARHIWDDDFHHKGLTDRPLHCVTTKESNVETSTIVQHLLSTDRRRLWAIEASDHIDANQSRLDLKDCALQ